MIQKKFLTAAIIAASLSLEALPVNAGVLGGLICKEPAIGKCSSTL